MKTTMVGAKVLLVLWNLVYIVWAQEPEPEFVNPKPLVVAVKGEKAVLPCRIKHLRAYRVLWSFERVLLTFNDRRIIDDTRISVERPYVMEWNLAIENVSIDDAGTYTCQINTPTLMSNPVTLHVLKEKPKPVVPTEVTVLSGADAEIKCKLPAINDIGTWRYKPDNNSQALLVSEDTKYRLRAGQGDDSNVHTLVIKEAQTADQGWYSCRARGGEESSANLRVVVPPTPPSMEVNAQSPNSLRARWRRPNTRHANVTGYQLYVQDHHTGEEQTYDVAANPKTDQESFTVDDLTTGTKYTLRLATRLRMGEEDATGKRSSGVNITTPSFVPNAPGYVKVRRVSDDMADVQWSPGGNKAGGIIRGYVIHYTPLSSKKKPILSKKKSIRVDKPHGAKWKGRLEQLRTRTRYHVQVAGFTRKGEGRLSKPVVYLHKAFPPEISLNGRVLSDSSVLLTVTSLGGGGKMTNVRMYYSEASQPSWKRLDFSPEWKYTVVGGLDPRSTYFFKVRAKVGGKNKQSVTHITTPPHELLAPQDVKVSATTSTSIEVTWDYPATNGSLPLGYIVHLDHAPGDGSLGGDGEQRHRQSVVFNRTSVEVKDLATDTRYNIQVAAINGFGEGPRSDGILFHISESDVKPDAVNEPFPPRFTHDLPERLNVQSGETVKITCVADGFPVPEVTWYDSGEPIGVPAQGSNQLYLVNVFQSTVLTCRAKSQWGEIEKSTVLNVIKNDTGKTEQDGLQLNLTSTNVKATTMTLAWTVASGDARQVDRFHMDILDTGGSVLLSRSLPPRTNSFNIRGLQPGTEYRAVLRALTEGRDGNEVILTEARATARTRLSDDEDPATTTVATATEAPDTGPRVLLTLTDLTSTSARLEWEFVGLDYRYVRLFDLKVKSRSNLTLLTESLQSNINRMDVTLQPGQVYYVQLRAFDSRGQVLASNSTRVVTPSHSQPAEGNTQSPVLKRITLEVTSNAVTSDSARLDWTVAGAGPDDVANIFLKVKDAEDRVLLRQEMKREARSLTLSNLAPLTKYWVELQALDDKGSPAATAMTSLTTLSKSAAAREDQSGKLRVFTEEVKESSVKVAWDTPPGLLPSMRHVNLRLTDIANVTLLTQSMSPLTRSLTVRNLQAGETYRAHVDIEGASGATLRTGYLEFNTEPTRGMPGRPEILEYRVANSSAVELQWRNAAPLSPAPRADDVTAYIVNFAKLDPTGQPSQGVYQLQVYGSAQTVVIPNLQADTRYMFQVAARNQYSFGPLSLPVIVDVPPK